MRTSAVEASCVMLRMVRDVFHISGFLLIDALGQVVQIVLNQAALQLYSMSNKVQ